MRARLRAASASLDAHAPTGPLLVGQGTDEEVALPELGGIWPDRLGAATARTSWFEAGGWARFLTGWSGVRSCCPG